MDRARWFIHPLAIFIFSTVALVLSLFLYIYWYVEVSAGLKAVIQRSNIAPEKVLASQTWVVILVLTILVAIILLGILIIFVYFHKTLQLYRLQNNFINNFTHELKTPVTSIKLYLETFLKYDLTREDRFKYVRYMIQDADRLSGNVSRILNLAKIESKTFKADFTVQNLGQVLERFLENNKHLFGDCEIRVVNRTGEPFFCRMDLPLFEMLVMNLLTNAIKYNKSPQPSVEVVFEPRGRMLDLHFRDNGLGLPPAELKKIFKKFYQYGRAEDMSARGGGVGLYLVDVIARLHKGRVLAHSPGVGLGSVFTVSLPRTSAPEK